MSKLGSFLLVLGGSWLLYRKATEFESNILVTDKNVKKCLFGQIDRYIVETDKGSFNVGRDILNWKFNNKLL
jgi:hypothetical protein